MCAERQGSKRRKPWGCRGISVALDMSRQPTQVNPDATPLHQTTCRESCQGRFMPCGGDRVYVSKPLDVRMRKAFFSQRTSKSIATQTANDCTTCMSIYIYMDFLTDIHICIYLWGGAKHFPVGKNTQRFLLSSSNNPSIYALILPNPQPGDDREDGPNHVQNNVS